MVGAQNEAHAVLRYCHMNNKIIIWIVVIVAVIAGGWYLLSLNQQGTTQSPTVATTTEQATTASQPIAPKPTTGTKPAPVSGPRVIPAKIVGVNTVSYLMGLKEPLQCAITTTVGTKRSGTMYVTGAEFRVNFATSAMIYDGTSLYAWMNGASTGLKLLASTGASGSAMANAGGYDPAAPLNFSCNTWTTDASVFAAPVGVTFSNTR